MALNLKETSEDFSNNAAVKTAGVKNKRVASKWQQFATAIETQKSVKSLELSENRSKLLSQREETRTRTVSFANKKSNDENASSFQSVCDVLLASIRAENTKPEAKNDTTGFQRPTRSSEKKKVARKNISISLNDLQKSAQITAPRQRVAEQTTAARGTSQDANSSPRHQRPKSAFDFTEEDELYSRKLYSSPPSLPRIHLQKSFRPKSRSFDRDVEFRERISVDENLWKDVHHYRYLRISPLRRSQTAPVLKQVLRS